MKKLFLFFCLLAISITQVWADSVTYKFDLVEARGSEPPEAVKELIKNTVAELDNAKETYENKLTYVRQQAQKLAKDLDSLLSQKETLQTNMPDDKVAEKIQAMIDNIQSINGTMDEGQKVLENAEKIVNENKAAFISEKLFEYAKTAEDYYGKISEIINGENYVKNGIEMTADLLKLINKYS